MSVLGDAQGEPGHLGVEIVRACSERLCRRAKPVRQATLGMEALRELGRFRTPWVRQHALGCNRPQHPATENP